MAQKRKGAFFSALVLVGSFLVYGCGDYAKIKQQGSTKDQAPAMQRIVENWERYNIYYAGVSKNQPKAILIYPKNSEKKLQFSEDRWDRVEDKKTLEELVSWLEAGKRYPRLLSIFGPDDQFFGYIYTRGHRVATRVIDPDTIFVYYGASKGYGGSRNY